MAVINIDVVSDFTCTWCFIGKRILDQTIALFLKTYPSKPTFNITYHPYFLSHFNSLDYTVTASIPRAFLTEKKLGHLSKERRDAMAKKMQGLGRSVGIEFKWNGLIGPTAKAHGLVLMAGERQRDVVEGLMHSFHEEETDINDEDTIREIALAAGLTDEDVDKALSDQIQDKVVREEQTWREVAAGKGVPVYIIQGQHRIDGAPDPGDLYEIFIKALEDIESL
ncbi:uncharacterized protein J7T54_004125 [Emericellopsis cladophorae]|uniref:DSBA-like thioredoxin domain-containing protein n=1 Tax=Emericellopsis cladophorae TaxID=2686198 RepID=A0A9P9XVJ7_9HYPO|nr:uncharacterized protein J7T54_004125 [Emericellopsis cladophorae]KAI6778230.1 hypothetical protein J7T54_004125 [Emericellopsis cladophorae]